MKNRKLSKSLQGLDRKKEDRPEVISGELGIPVNGQRLVEVPNRGGFVYVRLKNNTSELIQAYNASVSPIYGLPVLVARQNNIYRIIGRNIDRYADKFGQSPYLPKHGSQHSFNPEINIGGDIVWTYSQQFMPMLSYPSGSDGGMTLSFNPHFYEWNGQWKYAQNTGTPDYTPYLPTITGSARMVLSYIDPSDNSIKLMPGTPFSSSISGSAQVAQYIPDIPREIGIPLSAVRLVTGTTSIGWDSIYDVRDFYTVGKPSGSVGGGGGGAGIFALDDGVPVGTGTWVDFGNNLTVTMSGTVIRVNVSESLNDLTDVLITSVQDEDILAYNSASGLWLNIQPLSDAPIDNKLYGRRNGAWNEISGTSSSSASAGVVAWDEGVPLGTGTVFNFVGTGVTATISGSVVQIQVSGTSSSPSCVTTYQRVEQPVPMNSVTGTVWRVPDPFYASGSLGFYYNGIMQGKGIHYEELIYASGTYHLLFTPSTGAIHMVSYGVPCTVQAYATGSVAFALSDSNDVLLLDSNGIQLLDSNG